MVLVKGLTPIWIFLIFTFAMHLFLTKGGTRLIEIAFISIDTGHIRRDLYSLKINVYNHDFYDYDFDNKSD